MLILLIDIWNIFIINLIYPISNFGVQYIKSVLFELISCILILYQILIVLDLKINLMSNKSLIQYLLAIDILRWIYFILLLNLNRFLYILLLHSIILYIKGIMYLLYIQWLTFNLKLYIICFYIFIQYSIICFKCFIIIFYRYFWLLNINIAQTAFFSWNLLIFHFFK